jgi:hypothetical protein
MDLKDSKCSTLYAKLSKCWLINSLASDTPDTNKNLNVLEMTELKPPVNINPILPCDQCDFEAFVKHKLISHKANEYKRFVCLECDYKTNLKGYLTRHKALHKGKLLKCEGCNFSTDFKRYLRNHTLHNHAENAITSSLFQCKKCDLQTKSEQYLNIHIESTHNNTVRFKCDSCDYVFFSFFLAML